MNEPRLFLNMTRSDVEAELVRIRRENAEAKQAKRYLDVFSRYEQALDDALKGVDRCHECGKIRGRRKPSATKLDVCWDADAGGSPIG